MASVDMSVTLKASAEQVWNAIRGFNALPQWHPAVAKSHEKSEHGKTIRHLTLHGGGEIIEELSGRTMRSAPIATRLSTDRCP